MRTECDFRAASHQVALESREHFVDEAPPRGRRENLWDTGFRLVEPDPLEDDMYIG